MFFLVSGLFTAKGESTKVLGDRLYKLYSTTSGHEQIAVLHQIINLRITDSLERTMELSKLAAELSMHLNNDSLLCKSWLFAGITYTAMGKADSADFYCEKAKAYMNEKFFSNQSFMYYFLQGRINNLFGNYETAITWFNMALESRFSENDQYWKGRIFLGLSASNKHLSKPQLLIENLKKADSCFRLSADSNLIGSFVQHLGVKFCDLGLMEKANEQYLRSIAIMEKTADSLILGYAYINASTVIGDQIQKNENSFYEKGLAIFRKLKDDKAIAYALNFKGYELYLKKEYDLAIPYFTEGAQLKEKVQDWQGACFIHSNLARVYVSKKNAEQARLSLENANETKRKAADELSTASWQYSKGHYMVLLKDYDSALFYFNESMGKAQKLHVYSMVLENLQAISETYQSTGDASRALKYYKIYTLGKDSIIAASNFNNITELQIKYETNKKDDQIKALIVSTQKKDKNWIIILVITGFFWISLMAGTLYHLHLRNLEKRKKWIEAFKKENKTNLEEISDLQSDETDEKLPKIKLDPDLQMTMWLKLQELMQNEKVYLQHAVSLADMAHRLNTNTSYLSNVINEVSQQNFRHLVNQYRVEEACKMFDDPSNKHITIEGIAQNVGFHSKSAFNSAFKKIMTVTPSEYLAFRSRMESDVNQTG